jgi:ribosomal protein S18 acetylase RimI-like enzyme
MNVGDGSTRQRTRIVEIDDERDPLAEGALELITECFPSHERQPLSELRSEIEEKRLRLLDPFDFHLFVGVRGERVVAMVSGVYMAGINAGFITYLAVRPEARGHRVAGQVRGALVEAFRRDARRQGRDDLAWVLGEVRADGRWLGSLVRNRGAVPFDLTYYHPGMVLEAAPSYALYREPVGDHRRELPADEVRRIIYAIWRRGYRVRYPLERVTFRAMIDELDGQEIVGVHPEYSNAIRGTREERREVRSGK